MSPPRPPTHRRARLKRANALCTWWATRHCRFSKISRGARLVLSYKRIPSEPSENLQDSYGIHRGPGLPGPDLVKIFGMCYPTKNFHRIFSKIFIIDLVFTSDFLTKKITFFHSICNLRYLRFANLLYNTFANAVSIMSL